MGPGAHTLPASLQTPAGRCPTVGRGDLKCWRRHTHSSGEVLPLPALPQVTFRGDRPPDSAACPCRTLVGRRHLRVALRVLVAASFALITSVSERQRPRRGPGWASRQGLCPTPTRRISCRAGCSQVTSSSESRCGPSAPTRTPRPLSSLCPAHVRLAQRGDGSGDSPHRLLSAGVSGRLGLRCLARLSRTLLKLCL